jgi:hypothetical protein
MNKIIGAAVFTSGLSLSAGFCASVASLTPVAQAPLLSGASTVGQISTPTGWEKAVQSGGLMAGIARGNCPIADASPTLFECPCQTIRFGIVRERLTARTPVDGMTFFAR